MIFGGAPVTYPRSIIDQKLASYLPYTGGTVTGNLTVNGTLSTTLLEALSANITVIDIKQYELSGFNVQGNATVQGSVSATGDLTVHKRLNFAGDANGANNLYFVRNSTNNWTWGSNGVGDIMGIAGNSVTIGQDTTFTRQGITIRNLGETTGATLLGEAPDVLAQRRRTGTAPQEFRLYGLYDSSGANREYAYIKSLSASSFTIGTSATGTGGNRALEFQTAGSTRMTITSAGNVGIGTTTPSNSLHLDCTINKGILLTNSTQAANRANFYINVGNGGAYNCLNISESYDSVLYGHIQAYAKSLYLGGFANAQSTASVTILNDQNKNRLLELRSGDITSSAVFTVLSTGNVGIGTTAPSVKLDVKSAGGGTQFAVIRSDSTSKLFEVGQNNTDFSGYLSVNTGSTSKIRLEAYSSTPSYFNAGNVGIGTTTPNEKLTVVGSISTIGTTDLATFQSTTTQTPNIKIIGTDRNVTLTPAANGGNGTGLTGPSFYNAVRDSSSNSVRFQAVNSNGTVTYFQLWDDNATGVLAQRSGAIPQESRIYGAYTDASNYERFFIKTNVGATSATQIGLSAAGTGQNRNLEFVTGGSTRMTIASSGRVGIGTITPSTNLEITTASNGDGIKLNRSDGERVAWVIDEGAGNGALYLFNGSNSNTGYITGNGNSFLNGGNLGIGTGTPNEKLTVVGNISASGNITSNTRYVVSISLSADITANNGTDTPLIFPLIKADPSGWTSVSGSSTRITPTVPGYYNVSYMLAWRPGTSGSGNQNNIQIVKNGATVSLAQQPIHVSADVNTTQVATALVYMNGTTDYLTFQAYSSNAAQVIIGDSNWSKVEFFKIN